MYDVCVIGHVTRDIVQIRDQAARELPGGAVYYTGTALRQLGLATAVVTKAAPHDAETLLQPLRETGVEVLCRRSEATTVFENIYAADNEDSRSQRVRTVAAPFAASDLGQVRAKAFHLGPLTAAELPVEVLRAVALRGGRVSLDVQGFVRSVDEGAVRAADWPEKRIGLACVDVLKADIQEARVLSGESNPERAAHALAEFGPDEVIITLGHTGSLILADGEAHHIPAIPPVRVVDPTGCGDTFMAGYIFSRLRADDVATAGRFATALATLKLERHGPFAGNASEVGGRLAKIA